jgi:chemotaxis protein methyltransferase CheR
VSERTIGNASERTMGNASERPTLLPDEVVAAAAILAEFVGLRASGATEARLAAGVEARCLARRVDGARYLSHLAADAAERQALVDLVTVPETSWFREAGQIAVLVEGILARVGPARHEPVVVWSAGCAAGQEPYSVAIALAEAGFTGHRIIATDVSDRAVDRVAAGVYNDFELRGLSPARRDRWFERCAAGWRIDPRLRERVAVQRANLLVDKPPIGPGTCEAVLCRNVFIYLRRDRIAACLERFHATLAPGGRLFIGGSESLYGVEHRFVVERAGDVFVHRRAAATPADRPPIAAPPAPLPPLRPVRRVEPHPNAAALRVEAEQASRSGRHVDAVTAFRKAAYLDPTDPVAHLELGLALEAGGDPEAGRRAFQAARRALDRREPGAVAARLDGWSVDSLVTVLDAKLGVRPCP